MDENLYPIDLLDVLLDKDNHDPIVLMDENGRLCLDEAGLVAYNHGHYFALAKRALGRFGFSVMKPKTRKRIEAKNRRDGKRKDSTKRGRRRK